MNRTTWLALALGLVLLPSGCVTRRYVITSDPPGAVVYRNGQPIGATPVEEPFVYYGKYNYRLVKDGYQPLDVTPELCAPWYQWPGVDFVTENLIPYTFRDVQAMHFQLQPLQTIRNDDIRARAEELRQRGMTIQTPPGTEAPPRRNGPMPGGPGPMPVMPPPVPPPGPVVPRTPPLTPGGTSNTSGMPMLPPPSSDTPVTNPSRSNPEASLPAPHPSGARGFATSRSQPVPSPTGP